ncbi:MAG TPA: hypothetical protein VNF04_16195 [Stellaceae bacterium]|nr:hypothetical protein [Stellaceae bacterium]
MIPYIIEYGPPAALALVALWLLGARRLVDVPLSRFRGKTTARGVAPTLARSGGTPIYEIIAHVARRVGDADSEGFWPKARQVIREAALDKRLGLKGFRSEKEVLGGNDGMTAWHSVRSDVPNDYWINADISVLATSEEFSKRLGLNTFPQKLSNGKFTSEKIFLYAGLIGDWQEVQSLWP